MISKYSKYVPLNLPDDQSTELFVKGMEYKAKQIETNVTELQSYTDQVNNIDLGRVADKEYLKEKMNSALTQVNDLEGVDFSNIANVRKAKSIIGGVLQDKRILHNLLETKHSKTIMSQWEKIKSTPGLIKNYRASNYTRDMNRVQNYFISNDETPSIGLTGASLYTGIYEQMDAQGQKFKESTKDTILDGTYQIMTVKEKNKVGMYSLTLNNAELNNQLAIELENLKTANPNYEKEVAGNLQQSIDVYTDRLDRFKTSYQLSNNKQKEGAELEGTLEFMTNSLRQLKELKSAPLEQQAAYMLKHSYGESFVARHGSGQDVTYKTNLAEVTKQKLGIDVANFNLRERDSTFDNKMADKKYELDVAKFGLDEKIAGKKAGTDDNAEPAFIEDAVYVSDDDFYTQAKKTTSDNYTQAMSSLREVVSIVHRMPHSAEKIARVEKMLADKGIIVDLDAKDINKFLLVPSNLTALSAAMDLVTSNSGVDIKNPQVSEIRAKLSDVTRLSTLTIMSGYEVQAAEEAAKVFTKSTSGKAYEKSVNDNLKINGISYYQNKLIPMVGLDDKTDKDNLKASSYMNTLKYSKGYFLDEKGNAYRTSKNAVIAPGTALGSTIDLVEKKIDLEKSKYISLDPNKKLAKIEARNSDGESLGIFYVPLATSETKQLANLIMPGGYSKAVDMVYTEDNFYNKNPSKEVIKKLSTIPKYMNSDDLGMLKDAHIEFKTKNGGLDYRDFILSINSKEVQLSGLKTLAHLKQSVAVTYKRRADDWRKTHPNATTDEVHEKALLYTMIDLQGSGSK